MKKNITINLLERLYAIDEDAYELLKQYTDSLHSYFGRREGGEEIANDIEARIAELFDELKQQGAEAINIDHVRAIIHRLGQPDEMEEEGSASSPEGGDSIPADGQARTELPSRGGGKDATGHQAAPKRLYRNPADKKLMGVLSGFAAYFGGDVLWWRLTYAAMVLLSLACLWFKYAWFLPLRYFSLIGWFWGVALIIAYILLAALMPVVPVSTSTLSVNAVLKWSVEGSR